MVVRSVVVVIVGKVDVVVMRAAHALDIVV
jgi:hypothetical protein